MPTDELNIKLPDDRSNLTTQLMVLKQEIRARLPLATSARIFDYREIKATLTFIVDLLVYFSWANAALRYIMIFYQVVLTVESTLRQDR